MTEDHQQEQHVEQQRDGKWEGIHLFRARRALLNIASTFPAVAVTLPSPTHHISPLHTPSI